MTKQDLINHLVGLDTGLKRVDVEHIVDEIASVAEKTLRAGGDFTLPGIGKLKTKARAARTARNPKDGSQVAVPAKTVVKFTASKSLAEAVF